MIPLSDPSVKFIGLDSHLTDHPHYFVYWLLTNKCTYQCSYCPEFFHAGTFDYHPYDVVIKTMHKFPDPTSVFFGGGEPTNHPDFERIIEDTPDHITLGMLSNGARPLQFWEKISKSFNTIILSFHIEHAKVDRFLKTAEHVYLNAKCAGRINFPMHPKYWNESVEIYQSMIELGLPVTAKPIVTDFGSNDETSIIPEYTSEQLSWISVANQKVSSLDKGIGVYDENKKLLFRTNASELISSHQTNFNGWECHVPVISREIRADGLVLTMGCQQKKVVGNIFDQFEIRSNPEICRQKMCWCHADIQGLKKKI